MRIKIVSLVLLSILIHLLLSIVNIHPYFTLEAPNGPGEMGKAVKIENPDPETKAKIDKGWKDNAFNQ